MRGARPMLSVVMELACIHLPPRAWARLCRTSKEIQRAISTPLYWDKWFRGLMREVTEGRAMLRVYRSRECSCIGWDTVRWLPRGYTLSLPVQAGVSTQEFTRQLWQSLQSVNHDWLAHMSDAEISLGLPGLAPLSTGRARWHPSEAYLAGEVQVRPAWIPEGPAAGRERLGELMEGIMEDPGDATYETLEEMAAQLDVVRVVDWRSISPIADNRGTCSKCGRMFQDNGVVN